MTLAPRLIALRKKAQLTQQEFADKVGVHVNQVRRYEAASALPSLEAIKKIAVAMSTTIDDLVFGEEERGPDEELRLQFEAISSMPKEDKRIVQALLDGMIIKYQTKKMVGGLKS